MIDEKKYRDVPDCLVNGNLASDIYDVTLSSFGNFLTARKKGNCPMGNDDIYHVSFKLVDDEPLSSSYDVIEKGVHVDYTSTRFDKRSFGSSLMGLFYV